MYVNRFSKTRSDETLTCPFLTTGLSKDPCMPRMADCGGLMIGVPNSDPNTPPFEMVKVPPS